MSRFWPKRRELYNGHPVTSCLSLTARPAVPFMISAACAFMACGAAATNPASHSIQGLITLHQSMGKQTTGSCTGQGVLSDMAAGAQVSLKNESGKVLALGALGSGNITEVGSCQFPFKLENVGEATFFQVEVSHRGAIIYSRQDLDKQGWKVTLFLG